LALVVGCSSSVEAPAAPPPPTTVELSELPGPGTPLGDGLSVVPGTRLLGTVWPRESGTYDNTPAEDAWVASLALTGDPVEVYEAYLDQVQDAGFFIVRNLHDCVVSYDAGDRLAWTSPGGTEPEGREPTSIGCSFEAAIVEGRSTVARAYLDLSRTAAQHPNGEYASEVSVSVERWAAGVLPLSSRTRPFDRTPALAGRQLVLADPPPRPSIPAPGAAIDAGGPTGEPLTLVAGSQLLAPVASLSCGTGGFEASLRVADDDARAVVADYRRQVESWGYEPLGPGRMRFRRHDALVQSWGASGAGTVTLTVVEGRGSDPTYLRITRCRD
jgi:hypothetical protein